MEFADVVRRRRMVRHFAPDPIGREVLERIVATAQRAPSVAGDGFDPAEEPTV